LGNGYIGETSAAILISASHTATEKVRDFLDTGMSEEAYDDGIKTFLIFG
jgi:hypothetical protein